MALVSLLGSLLLLSLIVSSEDASAATFAPLEKNDKDNNYLCGSAKIMTSLQYCSVYQKCDTAGIISGENNIGHVTKEGTFAVCDKRIGGDKKMTIQVQVNEHPSVWKKVDKITCEKNAATGNASVKVKFENKELYYNEGREPSEYVLRCVSEGRARFDVYDFSKGKVGNIDKEVGLLKKERFYLIFSFISLLITISIMAVHYLIYLCISNMRLQKSVARAQIRHDELWLKIERKDRSAYDAEEVWNSMPLIHQQVAAEAALFLQRYKDGKFTAELRQWIVDRGYPSAATEIILELAGLGDPVLPFYAPDERPATFKNEHKLIEYSERIEARIVDTINYANRLKRRKIVFTDFRWLELHHLLFELLLTCLGSPSHPTIHDANIPALPRHAFGTRDDPEEEEREKEENAARLRRPHFLHHDWDEAQRLLGSEA